MNKPIDKQKLINFKNRLLDESNHYYDFASINENENEAKTELEIASKIENIANELEKIIYD